MARRDFTGVDQVVMEHDVASKFEEMFTKFSSDPQARERAKGCAELWTTGSRELFRVV